MIRHTNAAKTEPLHDAGVAEFFTVLRHEGAPPPQPVELTRKAVYVFGELSVGTTRFHQAAQVGRRVDRRIEIWRDDGIDPRDLCRIGGQWYLIEQAEAGLTEDGLAVTRVSLEHTDGAQWEGAYHDDPGG